MNRITTLFSLILLLLLAGCSSESEPTPTPVPPTPTPSPQDWLNGAIEAWNETQSFHFTLVLEGRAIALDQTGTFSFSEAEGDLVAPDSLQASTFVKTLLGNIEVAFVSIQDDQWITNPLNGEWEEVAIPLQTPVTDLFDTELGIGAELADLAAVERLDDETVDGTTFIRLRGDMTGGILTDLAPDLGEEKIVQVDLWLNPTDKRIYKVLVTEPVAGESAVTWTFEFSNYDGEIEITPPITS